MAEHSQRCCFCSGAEHDYGGLLEFRCASRALCSHINCLRSGAEFNVGSRLELTSAALLQYFEDSGLEGRVGSAVSPAAARELQLEHSSQLIALWRRSRCLTCSSCDQQYATLSCAARGCQVSTHLPCADPATSTLIAVPLTSELRASWLWLCPEHNRGLSQLDYRYTEPLPTLRAGNVCISIEDMPEDLAEALVHVGVVLPVGLAAAAAESNKDCAELEVIFADEYSEKVDSRSLIWPLQLPIFEPNPNDSKEISDVRTAAAVGLREKQIKQELTDSEQQQQQQQQLQQQQQQQQQQQRPQQQQQQQQRPKPKQPKQKAAAGGSRPRSLNPKRVNECGHPERPHHGQGMCHRKY
jgi:hypothetical protein